jgi:ATP-dependent exoDNAse (exonuclease V) beta subunit
VLDFARAYERRRDASSFRGFVEWLDRQADNAETPEAAVIEESSDGVRIMTVHAAKGLEFPVVVLCDPTAPKSPEYVSRYIEPERALWAQSLCDCEPVELVEQRQRVRQHDAAEIVRLAYVAATRAKDLLVVPCCADSVIDGWLEALAPALYPPVERRRTPLESTFRLPGFGDDAVVDRADYIPPDSVAPGEHAPSVGEQRVVWWDPNQLDLKRASVGGIAQNDLLRADDPARRDLAGLEAFRAWSELQIQSRARAQAPSLVSRAMTQAAELEPELDAGPPETPPVGEPREMQQLELPLGPSRAAVVTPPTAALPAILDGGAERYGRPSGPRFGTLVHALLANLDFRAQAGPLELEIARLGRLLGRQLAASEAEVDAAQAAVRAVLKHAFFERVRRAADSGELQREAPVTMRTPRGELLEGVVDLMFREHGSAGTKLILVDFKTDVELTRGEHYARQLELYATALRIALQLPVESLLFRV